MKFNASLLKTWENCQLQAKFKEVEKRPWLQHIKASFGTCIHDALEQYNWHGDVEKAIKRFKYTWSNPEYLGVGIEKWGGYQYGSLRARGIEILEQYHAKQKWEEREVIETEHKFCVPFGDHILSGVVDLLEVKQSGRGVEILKIVDYKTNTRKPSIKDLRLDLQFTVYDYASRQPEFWLGWEPEIEKYRPMHDGEELWERFQHVPRRGAWMHLWGNTEVDAGEREDADFLRMYRLLEAIDRAIEYEVYVPSIRAESCTFCDYKDICPAVAPILDKLEEPFGGDGDDGMF